MLASSGSMSSRAASRAAAAHTHADSDAGSASAACAATAQDGYGTEQWSYHNNPNNSKSAFNTKSPIVSKQSCRGLLISSDYVISSSEGSDCTVA